jgi:hypothetical protein
MSDQVELSLYPNGTGYIGKFILDNTKSINNVDQLLISKVNVSTIVILDRSGSMGNSVPRFVNQILPQIFECLEYSDDQIIHLVTFNTSATHYKLSVGALKTFSIRCQGMTNMAPGVTLLTSLIRNDLPEDCHALRLLTISDGEVSDQDDVQNNASKLASLIKNDFMINSQAVRLFTSSSQPDTRAVSSLLQLNNSSNVHLLDLKTSLTDDEMCATIASLFKEDSLHQHATLTSSEKIFRNHPWQNQANKSIDLFPGENIFWLDHLPNDDLHIGQVHVRIHLEHELTLDRYETLLKQRINSYMNQMRILKVIDTTDSRNEIHQILTYFQSIESSLLLHEDDKHILLKDSSLRARLEFIQRSILRKKKSFVMRMSQIANDDKVSQLNSAQKAEYLRSIDSSSKNARGLARRAVTQGLDFNEILRREVLNMAEHIHELNDVDDQEHLVSFFSQDTTLGGIRTVCQLADRDILDDVDANDILRMINIVGLACTGPIGEYPDPMTWRVNELHLGCYVSLSDVLTAYLQSNGQTLRTPATNKDITNVIPIIDDKRVARFLRVYAPSLLEYTCSIGMRRLLADVPMTSGYTVCAGLWRSVEDLNENRSELHMNTFVNLVHTYEFLVGNYFQHILPCVKEQTNERLSFYIGNNGTTNMISPLIKLYRENDEHKLQYIPNILRALYTYEVWQAIRRQYKNRDDCDQIAENMLDKLIGLDLGRYKAPVQELFEPEPPMDEIAFHDRAHIDQSYFDQLLRTMPYVNYLTLLPTYLSGAVHSTDLKMLPTMNEQTICEALKIDYDLMMFRFYNIVQALIYTTKASRVDSDNETMKIVDLVDEQAGESMVRDYIRKRFENQYATDLALKGRTERTQLVSRLIESILQSNDHNQMIKYLRDGLTYKNVHVAIVNSSSLGFMILKDKLLDLNENIPRRLDIIKVFLLGRDHENNDEPVWNNGNVLFTPNFDAFGTVLTELGHQTQWNEIKDEHSKRNLHVYRDGYNRHKHGNLKPSYWAFGHATLQMYKEHVSPDVFKEYCDIHHNCCGVPAFIQLCNPVSMASQP